MLSNSTRDPDTRRFFSHLDQKMYKIHLSEIHGRLCIGSSEGWLITVDELSELHALNPLTRASLALPSVATFFDIVDVVRDSDSRITDYVVGYDNLGEVPYEVEHMRSYYYLKAILDHSSAAVAVIHGEFNDLSFAHAPTTSSADLLGHHLSQGAGGWIYLMLGLCQDIWAANCMQILNGYRNEKAL
uniref:Uncharacterized protein LOC105037863 n=1 Tax=Elaeis guineensis var. tenera TaxID=51953 RepID=A0A6I9QQI6_ELAGV|nr:uncharacterized protein LOC105037863 [Elaeis guineensis]